MVLTIQHTIPAHLYTLIVNEGAGLQVIMVAGVPVLNLLIIKNEVGPLIIMILLPLAVLIVEMYNHPK